MHSQNDQNQAFHRSTSTFVPIRVHQAIFQQTGLEPKTAEPEYTVLALCANLTAGQNTVSLAALLPLVGPDIRESELELWAEQRSVYVTLVWRLDSKGSKFRTFHLLVPQSSDTGAPSIVFFGNLDWAFVFRNYKANFNKHLEVQNAAIAASGNPEQLDCALPIRYGGSSRGSSVATSPYRAPRDRSRSPARSWAVSDERFDRRRSISPRSAGSGANPSAINRATRHSDRWQQRRRLQVSHNLVETYKHYADDVFRSTGDPSQIQKALGLSRAVVTSELQDFRRHAQQGDDNSWLEKP